MKCQEIQKRFSAYLDGELDENQRKIIQSHLRGCTTCQEALNILAETWNLLDTLPKPEPVPYFYTRLKARMASEDTKKTGWTERILVPISATAAIVLGILVGSTVGRNGNGVTMASSSEENVISSVYIDTFDDFPAASLGETYFTLAQEE